VKDFSPIHLAQAIVHWLEYQEICGRAELFSEAYMAQPIGEYCLSLSPTHFEPEFVYPAAYQEGTRRKRALDFAVLGRNAANTQNVVKHAIETKFVTAKRQFHQEVYDDLYRLAWFQPTREPEGCCRWLVIAGYRKNLDGAKFLGAKVQLRAGKNQPQIHAFRRLLSTDINNATCTKPVHSADARIRKLWVESATAFGQNELPDSITVRLAGRYPATPRPTALCCQVWEVQRPQPDFASVHPI
jgi:hypothetical protein